MVTLLLSPTKPFSGFGWIETINTNIIEDAEHTTKPFSGFGWIETSPLTIEGIMRVKTTKPFSGFGWIETEKQQYPI